MGHEKNLEGGIELNLPQLETLEKLLLEVSDVVMLDTKGCHEIMNTLQPLKDAVHKEFVMQVFHAYKEGKLTSCAHSGESKEEKK